MNLCDINEIRTLLEGSGFHFSKAMGQNFLTARWVPERIADESGAGEDTAVLEIGPGVGCLTRELSSRAAKVCAVELDRRLLPVLNKSLSDCSNVEVINADALTLDLPELCSERFSGLRPVVCANLPYNITSPILTKLIDSSCFETITVMIQREVALRLCAKAGTPDYGAFTVYVNYYTEPELLFDVAPSCFVPQPKVTSSVIRLKRRSAPPAEVTDEKLFFRIVKASFAQRRKTLSNGLSAAFGDKLSKDELADIITSCGFDARIRGEALDIAGFAKIADAVGRALAEK